MRIIHALLAFVLLATPALAESNYPNHPIHFIVPFTPGGNVDVITRVIAQGISDHLKQTAVVDNRPGANTQIAATAAALSDPDGYTVFVGTAESMAINPQFTKVSYDVFKDFVPVGIVGTFPFALVVSPNLPVKTLAEFVAYARQNKGKLNFSSWGVGSTSQIAFEQFKQATGVDMVHVPFNGAAPAITAVTSGDVQAFMVPLTLAVAQAKGGYVKILGVTSAERQEAAPDIPTISEQGYPVVIGGWHMLVFPKGTPAEIVAKMNSAMNAALVMPSVKESLTTQGEIPVGGTPADAEKMIKQEWDKWGGVLRAANMSVAR